MAVQRRRHRVGAAGSRPGSDLPQAILLAPNDGGLPLIRNLSRRGVRVTVLATRAHAWITRSRWADGRVLEGVSRHPGAWHLALVELAERGDGVLISGTDGITEFLVRERERIPDVLRSFEAPDSAHLRLMDKRSLYELAAALDVRTPWHIPLTPGMAIGEVTERASYPCLLKPSLSHLWRRLFGDRRVVLVRTPTELAAAARPALDAGLDLIVSEYVPGPDRNLEGAVTVRRPDGTYALSYGRHKVRQFPPGFGAGSVNESAEVPETEAIAAAILDSVGFAGLSAIETKRHAETGELVLIEANVRLPQSFAVGDASGTDAAWRLYASLAGLPLSRQPAQRVGVRSIAPSLEAGAVLRQVRHREVTIRDWARAYRRVRDVSALTLRDPGPVVALGAGMLARGFRSLRRSARDRAARPAHTTGLRRARPPIEPAAARAKGHPRAILLAPNDAGLPVVRTLHRRAVPATVLVTPAHSWLARTRWSDGHVVPLLPAGRERWLAILDELAELGDGVLISGSDRATEFLVQERSRIPPNLRSFEAEDGAHLKLLDKASLYALAEQSGIRFPWTLRLASRSDLEAVMTDARYPCLLKPAVSHRWRRLFGDRRAIVIREPRDLVRAAGPGLSARLELLVTEYIPGPDENLETAVLLRQADGSIPLSYGLRKRRQYPAGFGAGSLTESAHLPQATAIAVRLLEAAGFVGLAGVELKRHAETGEHFLIEANVRLPGHFGLGDASQVDASWRLYATLAGLPLAPQPDQRAGVRTVMPSFEPRAIVDQLRQQKTSPRALLASYRGVRDISGLSPRDPGPVVALGVRELRRASPFLRRRLRSHPVRPPGERR